ncbi:MAG: class I SAM-dependent methyltransferase [Leptolinea sp.]|nr:class I SAM-dependent methyltransferase [Leptolinea sp.]
MENIQTFSQGSNLYASFRPQYPEGLFEYLAKNSKDHSLAWDCGTGTGQAACSCAKFFTRVIATDISQEQIHNRATHPRVHYLVMPAERTAFPAKSFDLVIVAQAVHWFNRDAFFSEVNRVLKPGGLLAIWGYGFPQINPEIDSIINEKLGRVIDPYWAEGNRLLMSGYRDIHLHFTELVSPNSFSITVEWDLPLLLSYFRTWSAVKLYIDRTGHDPLDRIEVDYYHPGLKIEKQ